MWQIDWQLRLIRRPSWNSIWPTPEVQSNDFAGFLDPENVGVGTGITFLSALVSKLQAKICAIWRPYWNSRWRPPGGVSELGPNRKLILQGSPISVPSFIISPQSEIFFDLTAGLYGLSWHGSDERSGLP